MPTRGIRASCGDVRRGVLGRGPETGIARGQADHPFDQIHAAHVFGDAVFHLQARIYFEKITRPRRFVVHKLDRTRGTVSHGFAEPHRRCAQLRTQ